MPELDEHTVIDGRYRILRHIGSGGMADVYCAEDTHLGRNVAVKLLYRRFAQDREFVERFRREASAAAALQHPNVVSVYDRGEFDDTYYIAMEYVEGASLKDVINREAPLDPARAIEIALKILLAARFAHRRGVIHRDLKPQNVIVEPEELGEDSVKVADFGIARAGASEITEVGAIMGTAQYLSPEQAQGGNVTEASDLYSIGVVLFEMLTGRAPFEGDSAVAIALKHVSQPPPSPRQLRPDISPALEAVVLKALAKEPVTRYGTADEMIRDLQAARADLASGADSDSGRTAAFAPVPVPVPISELQQEDVVADVVPEAAAGPPEPPPTDRRRRALIALGGLAAVAIVALAAFLLLRPEKAEVPVVVGQQLERARAQLEDAGFAVDIDRRPDQAPADTVFRQVPSGGEADEGSTVTLFVSNGPSTVKVPDVIGLSESDARRRVRRVRLRPSVDRETSGKVPEGNVIRTDPGPGTLIERGTRVTLVVSSGARQVTVPDVQGQEQEQAVSRLRDEGLNVVVRERESREPADTVVEQSPPGGQQVEEGSTVTLYVSNGRLREVPDVVGSEQGEAEADLRDAGFSVSVRTREVDEPDGEGRVLSQTPAGGRERPRGATVVITVGELPPAEPPGAAPGAAR